MKLNGEVCPDCGMIHQYYEDCEEDTFAVEEMDKFYDEDGDPREWKKDKKHWWGDKYLR